MYLCGHAGCNVRNVYLYKAFWTSGAVQSTLNLGGGEMIALMRGICRLILETLNAGSFSKENLTYAYKAAMKDWLWRVSW